MRSVTAPPVKRWRLPERNLSVEDLLQRELKVGPLVARVLAARGIGDPAVADAFLHPSVDQLHDPSLLPDFAAAQDVLLDARERQLSIFVHGDYDVDGVTSAALLTRFLQNIGCQVTSHVPHRQREGYGIHTMAVEYAREQGTQVFLTCDCGTSALAQVELAREYGMRVVVTDHHEVGECLPTAEAVINPHRHDSQYPFAELSGVGVVFKLCLGLTRTLGFPEASYLRAYSDLAALGTIADVMPLIDENRVIARMGLSFLPSTKKVGLQALMRVIGMPPGGAVRAFDVGFKLGPRLNAAGRIDDARTSLDLLLTNDVEAAANFAAEVDAANQLRRDTQGKILEEAQAMVEEDPAGIRHFLVAASPEWHTGVVGIVAGRLVERYHRPSLVVGMDPATGLCKGSARSIPGFNLAEAIHAFPELLKGGGHAAAAGCSFSRDDLDKVREALDDYAKEHLTAEQLIPEIRPDVECDLSEISKDTVNELAQLEPFGRENPEPLFYAPHAVLESAKPTRDGKHLQMTWRGATSGRIDGIGFNLGERFAELQSNQAYELLFEPKVEEWQGVARLKLQVRDYRPAVSG